MCQKITNTHAAGRDIEFDKYFCGHFQGNNVTNVNVRYSALIPISAFDPKI